MNWWRNWRVEWEWNSWELHFEESLHTFMHLTSNIHQVLMVKSKKNPFVELTRCQKSWLSSISCQQKSPIWGVKEEKLYSDKEFATREMQPLVETKGRQFLIEKIPTLVPDGSIFMQMRTPTLHSLISPSSTVRIVHCSWSLCSCPNWTVKIQMRI